jgi:hypothetical protein
MTKDHELAHTWLAMRRGLPHSPVLWAVAHDLELDSDEVRDEEAKVLAFQKALVKDLPKPWSGFFDRGLGDLLGH